MTRSGSDGLAPLLESFRADGDAAAMEELVRRTRPGLVAVACRIGAPQDAEDSVQAAYHALLGRREPPSAPILAWLLTAVVRIAYRRKAVAQREMRLADRLARPKPDDTPLERAALAEEAALIRCEVGRLPARYRNAVVLYHLEGLSTAETARLLEVPASTVTTRLQRGRALLRSRLGPVLLHGLMVLPWLLLDGGRALGAVGAASMGGVVKAKAGILAVGAALAAGTIGVMLGTTVLSKNGTGPSRNDGTERRRTAQLMESVEARDAEIAELHGRLAAHEQAKAPAGPAPAPGPGRSSVRKAFSVVLGTQKPSIDLEKARTQARELGVSEASLQVALEAYRCLTNKADPAVQKQALEALQALGDERMLSVAALVRGLESGPLASPGLRRLMQAATVPGHEGLFIDVLKDSITSAWAKQEILRHLDVADSAATRDYLVARLEQEEDRYFCAGTAMTLGRLRETRAIPALAARLEMGGDWRVFEPYMLFALGSIGGNEAQAVLVAYLRGSAPANPADAVRALAKSDADLARREAEAILAGPLAAKLSDQSLAILRKHAGR